MKETNNLPRGGGVVFDPRNLKKVSAIINKEGKVETATNDKEKKILIRKMLGKR